MSVTVKNVFEKAPVEMRNVLANALVEMGANDSRIIAMDADTLGSSGLKPFKKAYPDRYIDCGIQEANMVGVAAGMSATGKVPFIHSFGPFVSRRVYDQVFLSCCYAKLNVKLIGSDPGVTAAYNGGTHMPFEDMGALMSVPEITLVEPADSVQFEWLVRELQNAYGVYYIRLYRKNAVGVFEPGSKFQLGKAAVLKEGTDVCIAASGIMVAEALKAADKLAEQGISAAVLNTFTWKPLDDEALARYAAQCGCVVTAENHNVIGGLGSAVANSLARTCPVPVEMVGIQDQFGEVGTEAYLRQRFGLTPEAIEEAAKRAIARKNK